MISLNCHLGAWGSSSLGQQVNQGVQDSDHAGKWLLAPSTGKAGVSGMWTNRASFLHSPQL